MNSLERKPYIMINTNIVYVESLNSDCFKILFYMQKGYDFKNEKCVLNKCDIREILDITNKDIDNAIEILVKEDLIHHLEETEETLEFKVNEECFIFGMDEESYVN